MLNALLYQLRREFFAKKTNVIFAILGVLASVGMIAITHFISVESKTVFNPALVCAGISLVVVIAFDLALMGISSGDLLFTNSDVIFYLAGPFSPRFNLLLPVITSLKTSLTLMFVMSFQGAILSSLLGVRAIDVVILLVAMFVISAIGYTIVQIISASLIDKKKVRVAIETVMFALQGVWVLATAYSLMKEAGSFAAIPSLGSDRIIIALGNSNIIRALPFAGWLSLVVDGIYTGSIVRLILGIVLIIAGCSLAYIITNYIKFDYYEKAIESAQKIQERIAAQKAGVDMNAQVSKVKNDGKKHVGGFGPSVFFYKHINENIRATKLFFVNKLAFLYKIFIVVYLVVMKNQFSGDDVGDTSAMLVMTIMMLALLDTVVFAGGKAVVEITKPYFYLIPEKTSVKLFYTVLGGVPEIVFNALLSSAIIVWRVIGKFDLLTAVAAFVLFVAYDILCTYIAIIAGLVFKSFGKTLLTIVRYFVFWGVVGIIAVVSVILANVLNMSIGGGFIIAAVCTIGILLLASLLASKLIEGAECR